MIVKNVSGENRYFAFVPRGHIGPDYVRGKLMANGATATVPDNDDDVLAKVQGYVAAGALQIVTNPNNGMGAFLNGVNLPASGWISLLTAGSNTADILTIGGLPFVIGADPGSGVLGTYYASISSHAGYWAGIAGVASVSAPKLVTAINANTAATNIIADPAIAGATIAGTATTEYIVLRNALNLIANTGLTVVITHQSANNWVISGATLSAGVVGGVGKKIFTTSYTAVAADISLGTIFIPTGLANIGDYDVRVTTAAGVSKPWGGVATVNGSTLICFNNASTDIAATDVISVFAVEQ